MHHVPSASSGRPEPQSAPQERRRFLSHVTVGATAAFTALATSAANGEAIEPAMLAAGGYPYWVGPPGSGAPYEVNDAVGAQETINQALQDAGRGLVFVMGGRYTLRGPIFIGTGQTLAGAGPHGTFLNAAVSMPDEPMIQNRAPNNTRIVIRDIGLECAGRFGYGVRLLQGAAPEEWGPDPNHYLHRVTVIRPGRDGIYLGTSGYSGGARETKLNDCRVHDANNGISFRIEGASDMTVAQCVSQAGGTGFLVAGGNSKLTTCKAFFTRGPGFRFQSGRPTVTGCESQDAQGGCGFELVGIADGNFSGCSADSNGTGTDDRTSAGFYLENVRNVRLTGTTFQRSGGNGRQRWGIYFGPNVRRVLVSLVTNSAVGAPFVGAMLGAPIDLPPEPGPPGPPFPPKVDPTQSSIVTIIG
ncbi:MAG TPA: right-handed parallel beta-helix repeat-containing protein [Vicinamibacterales bacterium]